ncbi:MAG TPA: DNA mismatch repair protein MutS [Roseiflexaceae bacterium]|nr:DNA mismatch repair protein MutS [Roseiflexaceae bacterium]
MQYRELKASCPDAVLFYRMGDFYEAFDDDAKLCAELLEVTLTYKEFVKDDKRTSKRDRSRPMAGMPYHAVERYVGQLVAAGYRVAIAEQTSETPSSKSDTRPKSVFAAGLETSSSSSGMVERKIVRVLTPGTITDSGVLPAVQNNYLVALLAESGRIGLAYADLSTGEFACTEFSGERASSQALGELARLQAAEVLVPDEAKLRLPGLEPASAKLEHDLDFQTKAEREMLLPGERVARRTERESAASWAHGHITAQATWRWELRTARDALLRLLGVQSLAGFGLGDKPLATRAAGALIQYVLETQNGAATHVTTLRTYTTGDTMFLDPQTRRNLELLEGSGGRAKGSLVSVLDRTRTPMGARVLRRWIGQPLLDINRLRDRQDAVAHFVDQSLLRAELRDQLKAVGDMERAVNRVIQGVTVATPRDLVRLREALRVLPTLVTTLGGWAPADSEAPPVPAADAEGEDWEAALADALGPAVDAAPAARTTAGPSLREQREARNRPTPRYEEDDLFGDDGWDDEPAPAPEPPQPEPAAKQPVQPIKPQAPRLKPLASPGVDPCADVLDYLEQALDDEPPALLGASNYLRAGGDGEAPRRVIRPGFDGQMDEIVAASKDAQRFINELEPREQKRTGIKHLRVDYNKVFGYYIELPKSYADMVPPDYIRKQTLTTGERYITDELKRYESIILNAQERLVELERRAFGGICAVVAEAGPRLLATARALAEIDVYAALAEAAARGGYVRPLLAEDSRLRVVGGRHPVVEQALEGGFIPNDTTLDTDTHQILLITGPNMAGKSTVLRQVALIVLMAQIGSFVPAETAEVGLVDRIFTRIGAQDDIATGQSTFMVEMTETAALLLQSTRRSLIILDEVGRGTSTYDGMAIARAVVEYLHNEPRLGCRTLFATHYHELTELEEVLPRVKNYHMAAVEQEDRVVFLHELRRGGADRSYGIHVAELAGIPRAVIRRASELLALFEQGHSAPAAAPTPASGPAPTAPAPNDQLSLFDSAPHPALEMIRRLNVNELSPIEALTKLYELQRLAQR